MVDNWPTAEFQPTHYRNYRIEVDVSVFALASIFANVLAPVFLLVFIGYLAGPRLGIEARSVAKLAYYILTPAFIFNVFSKAAIEISLAVRMALFIVVVTTGCVIVALLVAHLLHQRAEITAAFVLVAAFGNVGNFGLPIIQFKLGDDALVAASFYFLILSTFGFVVGVLAATWHKGSSFGALLATLKTPAILAVFPALMVNGLHVAIPLFAERAIGLLASAMIPVMLLTLGIQLSGMGIPRLDRNVLVASTLRLVIGPALAFALVLPFGLSGSTRGAGIIQASMPAAVLAALIALEHDLVPDFVTTTVLFSTLASALTLTLVLAVV